MSNTTNTSIYDVIIIGSGPAGLTAAIYTTRAGFKTLVVAGAKWGGQLMLTSLVENFPGFPEGIQGPDLMANMRKQAEHHGAEIIDVNFIEGNFDNSPFKIKAGEKEYEGKAIIIATGADTKWLGAPGEKEKIGRGISSCAPCDAPFFRNKRVIVVGGGDSAMEEALVLTSYAKEVILVHRRDSFRASQVMQDKVKKHPNIHIIYNAEITEVLGEQSVSSVKIKMAPSDTSLLSKPVEELQTILPALLEGKVLEKDATSITAEIPTSGIFVAIGHMPNTGPFKGIDVDEKGFVKVYKHFHTNKEGVFVAGDVHDNEYKQAITASGFGCASALETERWLRDRAEQAA